MCEAETMKWIFYNGFAIPIILGPAIAAGWLTNSPLNFIIAYSVAHFVYWLAVLAVASHRFSGTNILLAKSGYTLAVTSFAVCVAGFYFKEDIANLYCQTLRIIIMSVGVLFSMTAVNLLLNKTQTLDIANFLLRKKV